MAGEEFERAAPLACHSTVVGHVTPFHHPSRLAATALIPLLFWSAACGLFRVGIVGDAMSPTLRNGDSAWITRAVDHLDRGDIIAFRYPKDEAHNFVQRIVGLPGDRIQMVDGRVSINGQPLEEPYVAEDNRSTDTWGPITIPRDEYFVLGDNRRNSSDSRFWGTVRRNAIWAKVNR